jgi:hypothetical protein
MATAWRAQALGGVPARQGPASRGPADRHATAGFDVWLWGLATPHAADGTPYSTTAAAASAGGEFGAGRLPARPCRLHRPARRRRRSPATDPSVPCPSRPAAASAARSLPCILLAAAADPSPARPLSAAAWSSSSSSATPPARTCASMASRTAPGTWTYQQRRCPRSSRSRRWASILRGTACRCGCGVWAGRPRAYHAARWGRSRAACLPACLSAGWLHTAALPPVR